MVHACSAVSLSLLGGLDFFFFFLRMEMLLVF